LDKALDCYHRTLELEPRNLTCLYNSGLILYSLDRPAEALPYFEKVSTMNTEDAEILEMVGLCYLRNENYKKALEYLEKAKVNVKTQEKLKSLEDLIIELKKTQEKKK
jgi:tetratricopeptide (TPR) repeat protein